MEHSRDRISAGQALAEIEHALNRIETNRQHVVPADRLEWVRQARRIRGRIEALTGLLTAEADHAQASLQVAGTPLDAWLGTGETLTRREASGAVYQARALAEHHSVGQAASQGQIGTGQARAIGKVLTGLAPQLDATQQQAAESAMLTLARHMDADQLARSAGRVLAQVKPEVTLADEVTRRQREVEAAHQQRSLRFFSEGASIRFDGSLPRLEGEKWIALLNARAEARRRTALEARDRLAEATTSEQRRADAFIDLLNAAANATPEPGTGTARVIVKLDYQHLHDEAAAAGLIGLDQELSAGELRQVCCDAEIIPMVLGGASQPLDVGRANRLVTAAIRSALTVRDGGCAFPGCDVRPELCEAHHIDPWWTGASTCVANLVLLCHHHHGLVEPAKDAHRDQWQAIIARDGLPDFLPPARLDPKRAAIRHRRLGGTGRITEGGPPESESPPKSGGTVDYPPQQPRRPGYPGSPPRRERPPEHTSNPLPHPHRSPIDWPFEAGSQLCDSGRRERGALRG